MPCSPIRRAGTALPRARGLRACRVRSAVPAGQANVASCPEMLTWNIRKRPLRPVSLAAFTPEALAERREVTQIVERRKAAGVDVDRHDEPVAAVHGRELDERQTRQVVDLRLEHAEVDLTILELPQPIGRHARIAQRRRDHVQLARRRRLRRAFVRKRELGTGAVIERVPVDRAAVVQRRVEHELLDRRRPPEWRSDTRGARRTTSLACRLPTARHSRDTSPAIGSRCPGPPEARLAATRVHRLRASSRQAQRPDMHERACDKVWARSTSRGGTSEGGGASGASAHAFNSAARASNPASANAAISSEPASAR